MKVKLHYRALFFILIFALAFTMVNAQENTISLTLTPSNYNGYNVSCFGVKDGSITANVTNGGTPPYKYEWSAEGGDTCTVVNLASGYYHVVVSDDYGGRGEAEITLIEPEQLVLEKSVTTYSNGYNVSCHYCADGVVYTEPRNGVPPYSYIWSDGGATQNRTGIVAGSYVVMVTDANGCTSMQDVGINPPDRDDWTMSGNAGTNPANQFIGTMDNTDLVFRTNNAERMSMMGNGDVKINKLRSDSTTNKYRYVYVDDNGILRTKYVRYCSATFPGSWLVGGNSIDANVPEQQYLGTCNWSDLVIGTSAVERIRIRGDWGFVGIGIPTGSPKPVHMLEVQGTGRFKNYIGDPVGMVDVGCGPAGNGSSNGFINSSAPLYINYSSDQMFISDRLLQALYELTAL